MRLKEFAKQKKLPFTCAIRVSIAFCIVTIVERVEGRYCFRDSTGFLYRGTEDIIGALDGGKDNVELSSFSENRR